MQVKIEPNSSANSYQFSSPFGRMSSGSQYPRTLNHDSSEASYQPFCSRYQHDAPPHQNYNYHYSNSSSSTNPVQYPPSNLHYNQNHLSNSDQSSHYYPYKKSTSATTDTDEARSRPQNLSEKLSDALKGSHFKAMTNEGAYNDSSHPVDSNKVANEHESHSDDEVQEDNAGGNNFDDSNENSGGNNLTLDDDDFIEEDDNSMNMISAKSHNLLSNQIKMMNEAAMNRLSSNSSSNNKIRKRSANQAYEFLVTLSDSRKFQDWLSNDETDFTWVHKRNSMTNQGKKYYYICNYRIKKGYVRCPAVIYALFPSSNAANLNSDSPVMVYACGQHEHRRINNGVSKHRIINPNPPMSLFPVNTSHHDDSNQATKSNSHASSVNKYNGAGKQLAGDVTNDSNGAYLSNLHQHVTKLLHQTCINQPSSVAAPQPPINPVDLIKSTVSSIMNAVSTESALRQQVNGVDESLTSKNNENLAPSSDKSQPNVDQNLSHSASYHRSLAMINSLRNSQDAQNQHSYHHATVASHSSRGSQFNNIENKIREPIELRLEDDSRDPQQSREVTTQQHQNSYRMVNEESYDEGHESEKQVDFERLQQDVLKRAANHILTNALSEFRKQQQSQALNKTSTTTQQLTPNMTPTTSSSAVLFNRKRILNSYLNNEIENEENSHEVHSNLPRSPIRAAENPSSAEHPTLDHYYRNVETNYQRQAAINQRLFERPGNEAMDYYRANTYRPMYHPYEHDPEGYNFLPSRHHKPKQRKELQFQHHLLSTQKTSASSTTMSSNATNSSNGNTSAGNNNTNNNSSSSKPNGGNSPKPVMSPESNSPSTSNSSNQSQQLLQISPYAGLLASASSVSSKCGTPRPADLCIDNAPIHIDVGGILYTSSLDTLTKYGESRLSKMFNGSLPIVLDSLKQHYFIDRDGKLFRHVLNFMRTDTVVLPEWFNDFDGLLNEAKFYELHEMIKQIEKLIETRGICCDTNDSESSPSTSFLSPGGTLHRRHSKSCRFHPINLIGTGGPNKKLKSSATEDNLAFGSEPMISDDLVDDHKQKPMVDGEAKLTKIKVVMLNETEGKLFISCDLELLKNTFPEFNVTNTNTSYVDKMCLSELEPKVYLVQVIERLYDHGFLLEHYYGKNVDSAAVSNSLTSSHTSYPSTVYMFINKQ